MPKDQLLLLNDCLFRNAKPEKIAEFVISQLSLVPQYTNSEGTLLFTTYYKGSVRIFTPEELNDNNKVQTLDSVRQVLQSAYSLSKNSNEEVKGEATFTNDNGEIIVELTSPSKDPLVDFPKQAMLRSITSVIEISKIKASQEQLNKALLLATTGTSQPHKTTSKVNFSGTKLELNDSTPPIDKSHRSLGG
jgi:hypothetical protein